MPSDKAKFTVEHLIPPSKLDLNMLSLLFEAKFTEILPKRQLQIFFRQTTAFVNQKAMQGRQFQIIFS